ncbi:MAG: FAD-dependent thymidylate synthase [Deltaproteobacteria bacterium]|nr:FAD-dependent thymidylate synthase [Deltaproteobacteria bacterium]
MNEINIVDPKENYNPKKDPNYTACLDHGFVRLVDVMGNDAAIVQAARVSYGQGTKSVRADRGLIFYLMQHRHTTPFEMVEFKFHCRMPIFVARQWIRHRTANVNEMSGRYSIMEEVFWSPSMDDLRKQSTTNRQGSLEDETIPIPEAKEIQKTFQEDQKHLYEEYQHYLKVGVAREVARGNLPLSIYTEWYWKIDLHNLLHFLELRLDAHAQKEIRVFAQAMAEFVKKCCPVAWEAFEEHVLHASKFSRQESEILSQILSENDLWDEVETRRIQQLENEEASPPRIERELANLKRRLLR